jgi:hypothetical protein
MSDEAFICLRRCSFFDYANQSSSLSSPFEETKDLWENPSGVEIGAREREREIEREREMRERK